MDKIKKNCCTEIWPSQNFIAKNMRLFRHLKDMNQADAAEALNMSRSYYCNLENGVKEPDFIVICKIADHYGVNLNYFIGFDISEHFISMITDVNSESRMMEFVGKYLSLSSVSRQRINEHINTIMAQEETFNGFREV